MWGDPLDSGASSRRTHTQSTWLATRPGAHGDRETTQRPWRGVAWIASG